MIRDKTRERWLFACLLVALMAGTIALKVWVVSVEQRLADNLQIHLHIVGDDKSRTNVLDNHERRLLLVERATWALWDGKVLCQ